jgi:hypothetical protein
MKKLFTSITICLISFTTLLSQESDMPIQKAKKLLEQIESKLSQKPGWDEPSVAIESGVRGLSKIPEFVELQQITVTASPQIISNIQSVAPSRMSKTILFVALQALPPEEYLQFLDQAVGLTEKKTVDRQLLKWSLFAADRNVRGVLDYYYDKQVTKDILRRVKALYSDDPNMVKYCDQALSGEGMKASEAYLNDNPSEPRSVPAQRNINQGSVVSDGSKNATSTKNEPIQSKSFSIPLPLFAALIAMFVIAGLWFMLRRKA